MDMTDMEIFLNTQVEQITYPIIRKAASGFWDEYANLRKEIQYGTLESLDIKYDGRKGEFYLKYLPFVNKCKELDKLGYSDNWEVRVAIKDAERVLFDFPFGWKYCGQMVQLQRKKEEA